MADNFNYKQFLMENRLGAYSKAGLNENTVVVGSGDNFTTTIDGKEYKALYHNHDEGDHIKLQQVGNNKNIKSGTVKKVSEDGDIAIELDPTNDYTEKRKAVEETQMTLDQDGMEISETAYSKQEAEGISEAVNPEGDKLVKKFLEGVAKKFDYGVEDAARFVKETIKRLGY